MRGVGGVRGVGVDLVCRRGAVVVDLTVSHGRRRVRFTQNREGWDVSKMVVMGWGERNRRGGGGGKIEIVREGER